LDINNSTPGKNWRVSWASAALPRERKGEYPGHQQQYSGKELESILGISSNTPGKNWRVS